MRLLRRVTWRHVSLWAALALVAQSEWQLALLVGWPAWIAWAAPLALDAYVLAAVRARRDLGASVLVSAGSVFGSHALHAWAAAGGHVAWWLTGAASAVPLLVSWRVHHLPTEPSWPAPSAPSPARSATSAPAARRSAGVPSALAPAALHRARPVVAVGTPAVAATPSPSTPLAGTSPVPSATARDASPQSPSPRSGREDVAKAEVIAELAAEDPVPGASEIATRYGVSPRTAARYRADAIAQQSTPALIGAQS